MAEEVKNNISFECIFCLSFVYNAWFDRTDVNVTSVINNTIKRIIPACNSVCKLTVGQAFSIHPLETLHVHYNLALGYVMKARN